MKPLDTERGAGEEFLKSAARIAWSSAGKKRSAGNFLPPFPPVHAAIFRNSSPAPNGFVRQGFIRNFLEPPSTDSFSKALPVQLGGVLQYK